MSSKVSFEGIGEVLATFYAAAGVKAGQAVKLDTEGKAVPCGAGDRFCGVAVSAGDSCAAVQVSGFARVPCSDATVALGCTELAADGSGGEKKAGSGAGREYLVVEKGTDTITILM